jgi:hypothetical protein
MSSELGTTAAGAPTSSARTPVAHPVKSGNEIQQALNNSKGRIF